MTIETLDDILENLADQLGIYGCHGGKCTDARPCRSCFTSDLRIRIERAVQIEAKLNA